MISNTLWNLVKNPSILLRRSRGDMPFSISFRPLAAARASDCNLSLWLNANICTITGYRQFFGEIGDRTMNQTYYDAVTKMEQMAKRRAPTTWTNGLRTDLRFSVDSGLSDGPVVDPGGWRRSERLRKLN